MPAQTTDAPKQGLALAADDPTASLMSLQIADWYTATFHELDDADPPGRRRSHARTGR
jgi:hypothetical protein